MYRNKKNGIIGIIITIIILILVVIFSNGETNSNFIENAATNLIMPIQNGLTYLKNKLGGNNTFFTDINNLKDENKELKQKNSELEQSLRELENIKTQNETLKEYKSQGFRDYLSEEFIRSLAVARGVQFGVKYAETFEVVRLSIN